MKPKEFFRNLTIRHKLLLITLTICATVVCIAVTALFSFQILNFRRNFEADTSTLATIIANNSAAAVAFDDRKAATETISSLKAKPTVLGACVLNTKGEIIAHFGEMDGENQWRAFPALREFAYVNGALLYTEGIYLDDKRIGSLFLRSNYQKVRSQLMRFYLFLVVLIFALSAFLALWLSEKLGRLITRPLSALTETARRVGEKNDYSARLPMDGRKDELGLLGATFNQMLQQIQQQDQALNLSQQKLGSLVNSIDGIVWVWDAVTLEFTFVSEQCHAILGYPPEDWLGKADFWDRLVHPDDFEKASAYCTAAVARREPYHYEYRMLSADKQVVWIRESGVVLTQNDQVVAFRGIFQDITEQKRAAVELEQLNRKLVDTSRQAGMAEVATGVLHNVGNVLNSVNVSTTLLNDELEKSKILHLQQAAGLMREHLPELPAYLSGDTKGRLLPEFIIKVADAMNGEHLRWRDELRGLKKNIEHMKEIVAMQQSYAKVSGLFEALDAEALVADALQVNLAGLERHSVEITRDFQPTPKIMVDKHKVMQILINLIRNAKYALDNNPPLEKRLLVRIGLSGPDRVKIVVQDNGMGISTEDLTRIFAHGFTTKTDGHGFGLHSGALAAKELGGSLTASSEGLGRGAVFTLELPVANNKN
jgi:PAS domain S-box-containing protein